MPLERAARAGPRGEVRRPDRARVVFAAIDAVGVCRDRPAPRVLDPEREQELSAAPAAAAFALDGHRAFPARDQRRRSLGTARQGCHFLADVARLAGDGVAKDLRPDARLAEHFARRLERAQRSGDHFILRFHRLGALGERPAEIDAIPGEDRPGVVDRRRVGGAGAGGNVRGIVADHVRNDQRDHLSPARGREAAAGDGGEVLAHRVHLADLGAALQQLAGERLELGHRHAGRRQRQQARAAAGDEDQQQVIGAEALRAFEDLARRALAGLVGDWMTGLDHADALRRQAVLVAGDRDSFDRHGVVALDRQGHRRRGFARGGDENPAARRRRQVRTEDLQRIGRGDGGAEAFFQEPAHQVPGVNVSFAASPPSL
jgi:hypothetical protein